MVTFVSERINSLELVCSKFERGQQHKQSQSVNGMSAAPSVILFVFQCLSGKRYLFEGRMTSVDDCCSSADLVATPSGAGGNIGVG